MRIAIVDDDPIVCQSLETILTATGTADVLWTANDGGAAVQQYFASPANHPDILLIDIQMPGKDGLDAAREILPKDPAARILFLTTFADKDYIAQAMALGAKGYLIKQDVAAVGPALQAVMAGQVVLGAEILGKLTERTTNPADSSNSGNANDSAWTDQPHAARHHMAERAPINLRAVPVIRSAVLHDDAVDSVGHALAVVGALFKVTIHIMPCKYLQRIGAGGVQRTH